jgi:carboxymuconolactone decarboxylase family protein
VGFTDDVLFGQAWTRPELSPRDRSLVTVASLVTSGSTAQLTYHLGLARQNGVTETELIGAITHLASDAGWPRPCQRWQSPSRCSARTETETSEKEHEHEHRAEAAHDEGARGVVHQRRLHRPHPRPQGRAVQDGLGPDHPADGPAGALRPGITAALATNALRAALRGVAHAVAVNPDNGDNDAMSAVVRDALIHALVADRAHN